MRRAIMDETINIIKEIYTIRKKTRLYGFIEVDVALENEEQPFLLFY